MGVPLASRTTTVRTARVVGLPSPFARVPEGDGRPPRADIAHGGASAMARTCPVPIKREGPIRVRRAILPPVTLAVIPEVTKIVGRARLAPTPPVPDARVHGRRRPPPVTRIIPAIGEGARPNVGEGRVLVNDGVTITSVRGTTEGLAIAGPP